jgi:hypothetical protein
VSEANGLNLLLGRATVQRRMKNMIARRCWKCGLKHTRAGCQAEALEDGGGRVPMGLEQMCVFEFPNASVPGRI